MKAKKNCRKNLIVGIIGVVLLLAILATILWIFVFDKTLRISQYKSECGCEHWSYDMSVEGILAETKCNYGTNRTYWCFEAVSSGEVTLYWEFFDHEGYSAPEKAYSVTYRVDNTGNISCIGSENEPEKIELFYNWYK